MMNVCYRCVGMEGKLECDVYLPVLAPGSMILLCSNGLWQQVDDADILGAITDNPHPQDACDTLISLANAHGGDDNVTVIVVDMPGSNIPPANGQ